MEQREDINPRNIKKAKTNASPLGLLDSLETQLKKQQKIVQSGKNALRSPDPPYVDIMVDTMLSIFELESHEEDDEGMSKPKGTPESNSKKTEFEVRFGKLHGKNFHPGITVNNFAQYKAQLDADPEMACDVSETTLYYYDLPTGDGNTRIEVDPTNQIPLRSQTKKRLKVQDVGDIYALPYDIRYSVASETEQPAPTMVPSDHKLTRVKTRWSYYKPESPFTWHIDLTEVKTLMNGEQAENETVTYELEFDFNEDVIDACRRMDKSLVRQISTHFWDFAVRLVNNLHKSGSSHFDPSLRTEKVTEEETLRNLRETALNFIVSNAAYSDDFPGSMPVNFTKESVGVVQASNYWVSEKTDGIRAMLIINPRDAVYLVDRKFDFYALPEYECLLNIYSPVGLTVLDGEMITHLTENRLMYLIFDITALNGQEVYSLPLHKRLPFIQKVVEKYRNACASHEIPELHPFELIGKTFHPKSHISDLLHCIKEDKQHGGRVYQDKRRHHKSDGVIFTPDEPYRTKTVRNLFKFKYADEMSIDLKLSINRGTGNVIFTCVGDRGVETEYPLQIVAEDYQRLSRYASHILKDPKTVVIVELVYDLVAQKWKLKMVRTDKNRANYVRVVSDTIKSVNEHIGTEDLKRYFAKRS